MDIALPVIGGLALFLYGIDIMGESLGKAAGEKLTTLIEKLTANRFKAVLLGILITVMVQSSSAATVMVVGLVNADLMTLTQAVGVIMGANVGATVTTQMIALDLTDYAPIVMGIGIIFRITSSREKVKDIAETLVGFGMIFLGMGMMSQGFGPLSDHPNIVNIISSLNNPILGVLAGVVITTILQSSAPVVGLIQALSAEGVFGLNVAFPIVYGSNIGTTTTALLSSIGTNVIARRAAMIHFLFNFIGTIIFVTILKGPVEMVIKYISPNSVQFQVANVHTLFNILNALIQLPFAKLLVKITEKLVPGTIVHEKKSTIHLDSRILQTPSIALGQTKKEVLRMGNLVMKNLSLSEKVLIDDQYEKVDEIFNREKTINNIEKEITEYLVELSNEPLSEVEHTSLSILLYTINDIERIGDHVDNLGELSLNKSKGNLKFSQDVKEDLREMFTKSKKVFTRAIESFEFNDKRLAKEVLEIEEGINKLEKQNREGHLRRLNRGICLTESGIIFLDTVSNLERVSDHSSNIAKYIIDKFKR